MPSMSISISSFVVKREKLILNGLFLTSSLSPIFLSTEL